MKYIRKPIAVYAVQLYVSNLEQLEPLLEGTGATPCFVDVDGQVTYDTSDKDYGLGYRAAKIGLLLPVGANVMFVREGDYVIKDAQGLVWSLVAEQFEGRYEHANN